MTDITKTVSYKIARFIVILGIFYAFFTSVDMLGVSLTWVGRGFAESLIRTVRNPVAGLFIGLFVTSLIHSSACTTAMIVTLVSTKITLNGMEQPMLPMEYAIPLIMGANIGTTVTSAMVSLGQMGRKEEFRRAMSGAMVHDMYNIIAVAFFLPLELLTHLLQTTSRFLAEAFKSAGGVEIAKPLDYAIKPVSMFVRDQIFAPIVPLPWAGLAMGVFALGIMGVALVAIAKIMRKIAETRFEVLFDKYVGKYPYLALLLGIVVTAAIQSSSIVTSMLVPMVGAGIMTIEQIYPVMLGADIGTTITAILAGLARLAVTNESEGLAIAFVHTLLNVFGVIVFFMIPGSSKIPIGAARYLARILTKSPQYAIAFVIIVFYGIPGAIILLQNIF